MPQKAHLSIRYIEIKISQTITIDLKRFARKSAQSQKLNPVNRNKELFFLPVTVNFKGGTIGEKKKKKHIHGPIELHLRHLNVENEEADTNSVFYMGICR